MLLNIFTKFAIKYVDNIAKITYFSISAKFWLFGYTDLQYFLRKTV